MRATAVELYAGAGGWTAACDHDRLSVIGVERDLDAVATGQAAGLDWRQVDLDETDPWLSSPDAGLIASPPCQSFSLSGRGEGRRALDVLCELPDVLTDDTPGNVARFRDQVGGALTDHGVSDDRTHHVLLPLWWALRMEPRWLAWEQVPPVLPVWQACATVLEYYGWSTWTGLLSAERYGVPQTRRRAFLIAHRDRPVGAPPATHQRYVRGRRDEGGGLFDLPAPQRVVHPDDVDLLPWVSMADALGGDLDSGARFVASSRSRAARRAADQPAPTILFGASGNEVVWAFDRRQRDGISKPATTTVTCEQAAALQSFPAGWPFVGSATSIRRQVGNAVPPLLGRAVLQEATGLDLTPATLETGAAA